MNILIIGNGFDIAHELNTRYSDFLESYKSKNPIITNLWIEYFIRQQKKIAGNKWMDLENEIYNFIGSLKNKIDILKSWKNNDPSTVILCNFVTRIPEKNLKDCFKNTDMLNDALKRPSNINNPYKNNDNNNKNQLSLLDHLNFKQICKDDLPSDTVVTLEKGYVINLNQNFSYPTQCLFNDHIDFIKFLYDELRIFVYEFNKYLNNKVIVEIKKLKQHGIQKFKLGIPYDKTLKIINFNYTNTLEQLYNQSKSPKPEYIYIHGKLQDPVRDNLYQNSNKYSDINLVLGTESFSYKANVDRAQPIDIHFNIFQKHNQRHLYGTITAYQKLLISLKKEMKKNDFKFHILGHSLDRSDHNILKYILLPNTDYPIIIYYHNPESHERLITNITEILGEEEVMRRVQFIDQHDPKRGILLK